MSRRSGRRFADKDMRQPKTGPYPVRHRAIPERRKKIRRMTSKENVPEPTPEQASPMLERPPVHHRSIGHRIRNYFLTGLIVAGPLAITLWLTWSFITWVDGLVRPFIPVA